MSSHDLRVTLRQLADFIAEANALTAGKTLEAVVSDPVLLRAFERVMELVGESAKRLPVDLREKYPEIPWRKVAGMRDVISHAYEDPMILRERISDNPSERLDFVNTSGRGNLRWQKPAQAAASSATSGLSFLKRLTPMTLNPMTCPSASTRSITASFPVSFIKPIPSENLTSR